MRDVVRMELTMREDQKPITENQDFLTWIGGMAFAAREEGYILKVWVNDAPISLNLIKIEISQEGSQGQC